MNRLYIAYLVAAITLAGCGNSPLFNHDNADDLNRSVAVTDSECPLAFASGNLCASIAWKTGPSAEESAFQLKFWNANDTAQVAVDPTLTVAVQLWMPDMGHGSSPVTLTKTAPGLYDVTRVFFIMPGQWDLRVQLKNGADIVEQAIQTETIH